MKKIFLTFLILAFPFLSAISQTTFKKIYSFPGNHSPNFITTNDNGFLIYDSEIGTNGSVTILKIDSIGTIEWTKKYSLLNYWPGINYCIQTSDSGYVLADNSQYNGSDNAAVIIKLNQLGDSLWIRAMPWDTIPFIPVSEYLNNIIENFDHGLAFVSTIYQPSFVHVAAFTRLDSISNPLLKVEYQINGLATVFTSIAEISDGSYLIAGKVSIFSASFLMKIDSAGQQQWCKLYSGTGGNYFTKLEPARDGGFIVGGVTNYFNSTDTLTLILKVDSIGNIEWGKRFQYSGPDFIKENSDNTIVFGGSYKSKWLVKTNSNGDTLWTRTFSNMPGEVSHLLPTNDGGFAFCGKHHDSLGTPEVFLYKSDSSFNNLCFTETPILISNSSLPVFDHSDTATATLVQPNQLFANIFLPDSIPVINTLNGCIYTNTKEINTNDFILFPNPSNNSVQLKLESNYNKVEIEFIDSRGISVINTSLHNPNQLITINVDIPEGLYFILLKTNEGITARKLIIQK